MDIIGIICEYNPFHNGHIYHLKKIKEMYPNSLIILVLNGYFLERGEISILTKEDKVKIALQNNIDLVIELPFVFGCQSADTFANISIKMLNELNTQKLIFGSECNDIEFLTKVAKKQLEDNFNQSVKNNLKKGMNYPTALNKSLDINLNSPNDLLAISYIKSIIKNNYNIEPISIQRTNDYHDISSNDNIISASNIRNKLNHNYNISKYTPYSHLIKNVNKDLFFNILKYKIVTDPCLNQYLTVDEGIEHKLIKEINNVNSIDELINRIKSKRYTYNRINRMLLHILIGLTKEDRNKLELAYIKVLGFNSIGQKHLNNLEKDIPIQRKINENFLAQQYELKAANIYDMLLNKNALKFELNNKPIKK